MSRKLILIGLAGLAGAGKDTAANHLVNAHGFQAYAFADPLRAALKAMFNLHELHYSRDLKEKPLLGFGKSPRQLMQSLGTEWGRNMVHPDMWLMLAGDWLQNIKEQGAKFAVITDIRFENEAQWVRDHGGQVWHLRRRNPNLVNPHISEQGVMYQPALGDLAISNNGSTFDLHELLDFMMNQILEATII